MIRLRRFSPATLVGLVMLAGGCASAPKPADNDKLTSPKLISSPRPELRFSRGSQARPVDIRVEVQIDAAGRPNIETLRVTGSGAADNRDLIAAWLQSSQFEPARRDGRSVPGTFKTRFRLAVRRL